MIRAALVALVILASCPGCRPSCPRCVTPVAPAPLPEVTVVTETVSCLSSPGPRPTTPFVAKGPREGCQPPFTSCLERADAAALRAYLDALETWRDRVEARCAAKPPQPEDE